MQAQNAREQARADIAKGIVEMRYCWAWQQQTSPAIDSANAIFGFRFQFLKDCDPNDTSTLYQREYNEEMTAFLTKKHGEGWREHYDRVLRHLNDNEVLRNTKEEKLAKEVHYQLMPLYFKRDKSTFDAEGKKILRLAYAIYEHRQKAEPKKKYGLYIWCYAYKGEDPKARHERALAVQKELVRLGIPENCLSFQHPETHSLNLPNYDAYVHFGLVTYE